MAHLANAGQVGQAGETGTLTMLEAIVRGYKNMGMREEIDRLNRELAEQRKVNAELQRQLKAVPAIASMLKATSSALAKVMCEHPAEIGILALAAIASSMDRQRKRR